MKKYLKDILLNSPLYILIIDLILFFPGVFTYFHQDDFIHFSYSQTLTQVFSAFNIFHQGNFPFYRPIPTQLYFYAGKLLFGFNPLGYHIVNFVVFSCNIFLVHKLVLEFTKKKEIAIIATFFYGLNSTHFAPLYSPAYVHELFYVLFGLNSVLNYYYWLKSKVIKRYLLSLIFFVLAMMTKETAVVIPGIIMLLNLFMDIKPLSGWLKKYSAFILITIIYLSGHFLFYGIANSSSYTLIFGKANINILIWYFLWALSTPNILIDYFGPGFKMSSVFFAITKINGLIYIVLFPVFLSVLFTIILRGYKNIQPSAKKIILFGISWFIIGLIPLLIFPLHRLATEQAFSLTGLSLALGIMLYQIHHSSINGKRLFFLLLGIYFVIATNSILIARYTHWIVRSAAIAKNTLSYFQKKNPEIPNNQVINFINGTVKIPQWGSSRQIYYALGNGYGLKMILNKPLLEIYFEDINPLPLDIKNKQILTVDSSTLLDY